MKNILTAMSVLAAVVLALGIPAAYSQYESAPPNESPAGNYVLSPNDIILVKVFQEADLDSQHRISRDGTINFPLIGLAKVGGSTVEEAAITIRRKLMEGYIRNPQVRVNILQYSKRRVTVLGQVQKPGTYVLPDEESIDLLQAVAMAGGFTRLADTSKVIVRRSVDHRESVFQVNAKSQTRDKSAALFQIQPDDKVTVGERLF